MGQQKNQDWTDKDPEVLDLNLQLNLFNRLPHCNKT